MKETYFTLMDNASGKFITRFTEKSKRVYLVKNPFNSNYFNKRAYAEGWLSNSGLDATNYTVMQFESIEKPQ